jgi:Fe2+ or Zn2+ uptake regulation protein
LCGFGVVLNLGARIANGETPAPAGYRLPAAEVATKTGQPVATVRRQLRALDDKGIIQKTTLREATERKIDDPETGERDTIRIRGIRDVTYIHVPDGDVGKLIDAALAFKRPEDAPKRGGHRIPTCTDCGVALQDVTVQTVTVTEGTCYDCGQVHRFEEAGPQRPVVDAPAATPSEFTSSSLIPEQKRGHYVKGGQV